jgi:HlyD family secretion protein
MVTAQEFDTAQANHDVARATVAMSESAVTVAQANLEEAKVNLGYTTIRSPVKGVIIDRRVNVGQTVIASLNAPSLFLIARDLDHLQIWASVNETDIGGIREGQSVRFTVSAFAGRTFHGTVAQVRLNANMVQNVVTYTVVIDVENKDRELKPYLTARVEFERERRENVLIAPNAALRWRPRPDCIAPDVRAEWSQKGARAESASEGVLWVRNGDFVRPMPVRVGLSDGISSEVYGEAVRQGLEVVTGLLVREGGEEAYSILPHTRSESSKREASEKQ